MKLSIRYLTNFTYDTAVNESHNLLRARPAETPTQQVLSYRTEVDPAASMASHVDYWGTWAEMFSVVGRHTRLTVLADSNVETATPPQPEAAPMWKRDTSAIDYFEYVSPSPHVEWDETVAEIGRSIVEESEDAVAATNALMAAAASQLTYESGSTEVGIPVVDLLERGRGVCQDYSHLSLAVFRSAGIPARYVSGYLYAVDISSGTDPDEDEIQVATHAWIEVLIPGFGWWGLDPTNRLVAGERHVKIGHGRDYEDVMPLRGVYHGDSESGGLEVAVTMSRNALDEYEMSPRPAPPSRRSSVLATDLQQQQQQ